MRGRLSAVASPAAEFELFDRRLNGPAEAPVAVALSGGGDSLALLRLAKAWADHAGRRLIALTVDHGLQPASAAWSRFAAERAARAGVAHRTLAWSGPKPAAQGLPAAARAARHALLAQAARVSGARVILMGHTADDLIEATQMRLAGATTPSPRVWSPSPAWPEGRGVFLFRPLLAHRRAELRALLRAAGEVWIDDPANDDPRYARALARRQVASTAAAVPPEPVEARPAWPGLAGVAEGVAGDLVVARSAFAATDRPAARRALAALAVCAAGGSKPPSAAALDPLLDRLMVGAPFVASLAGARLALVGDRLSLCREAGEFRRAGLGEAPLPVGESVFDGRVRMVAREPGWRIAPLRGLAARLPAEDRRRLAAIPPSARAALPAAVSPAGEVSCPMVLREGPVAAFSLTGERLYATLGVLHDEASLWRVAKSPEAP